MFQRYRSGCAVLLGRRATTFSRTSDAAELLLYRRVSGDQGAIQRIHGRDSLPSKGRFEFPARLEQRDVSERLGESSRDLGFAGGRPRLRKVGWQAIAP